jgi:hypothetical protein
MERRTWIPFLNSHDELYAHTHTHTQRERGEEKLQCNLQHDGCGDIFIIIFVVHSHVHLKQAGVVVSLVALVAVNAHLLCRRTGREARRNVDKGQEIGMWRGARSVRRGMRTRTD